jgi:hypothetical protein
MTERFTLCINVEITAQNIEEAKRRAELLAKELRNTYGTWVLYAEEDDIERCLDVPPLRRKETP